MNKIASTSLLITGSFLFNGCFATHPNDIAPKMPQQSVIKKYEKLNCNQLRAELEFSDEEYNRLWQKQYDNREVARENSIFATALLVTIPIVPFFFKV
jgi:hypothetical protein